MKAFLRNVIAAGALAALGIYILRQYPNLVGLTLGVSCIFLSLGIAFPTQMQEGAVSFKGALVMIVPVVLNAIKGGQRKDDPPADPPSKV